MEINLSGKYIGKQYVDNTSNENTTLDPYGFADLRFQYTFRSEKLKAVSINFLIQNLFNSHFSTNAWTYRFVSPGYDPRPDLPDVRAEVQPFYNQTGFFPQAGRNFLVGLRIKI